MPRAVWGTPQPASLTDYTASEPRGLFDLLGGGADRPDMGQEIADRGGVIAQILMNLGAGRGGAGIAEATAAAGERSDARHDKRKTERMVNRAADKIEPSNPELAMMMRANPAFGMAMIGKQYESQWDAENDIAKVKKQYELAGANDLAVEDRKAALKAEERRLRLKAMGFDMGGGGTSQAATSPAPAPVVPDAGVVPPPTDGVGGGGSPAPVVSQPQQTPPPAPTGDGIDWTAGLTTNPQLRAFQLQQRKAYNDPELPVEDAMLILNSELNDTVEGTNQAVKNIAERKQRRARVQGIQTRGQAADATFQAAQGLPGINMNAPGEMEMRGAGIDPKLRPDLNPAQTAERMRTAAETGDEQYNSLLTSLAKPPGNPGSVRINPETGELEVVPGVSARKVDQEGLRNTSLALRVEPSMAVLDNKINVESLTSGTNPLVDATLPAWLANQNLTPEFKLAKVAGANFLSGLLRKESLSAIKEEEFAQYGPVFLPQYGDDPALLQFKSELRQRAYQGMLHSMDPEAQMAYATKAYLARQDALAKGEAAPPLPEIGKWPTSTGTEGTQPAPTTQEPQAIPPISKKALAAGITPYQWAHASEASRRALSD